MVEARSAPPARVIPSNLGNKHHDGRRPDPDRSPCRSRTISAGPSRARCGWTADAPGSGAPRTGARRSRRRSGCSAGLRPGKPPDARFSGPADPTWLAREGCLREAAPPSARLTELGALFLLRLVLRLCPAAAVGPTWTATAASAGKRPKRYGPPPSTPRGPPRPAVPLADPGGRPQAVVRGWWTGRSRPGRRTRVLPLVPVPARCWPVPDRARAASTPRSRASRRWAPGPRATPPTPSPTSSSP